MKNITRMMLSTLAVIIAAGCAFAFPDVNENHWAAKQITELGERGIVVGYPDGTFQPDENVTRAEFASMAIKALGQEDISVAQPVNFTDVTPEFWAYSAIQKALYFELIAYNESSKTFRPDDTVSRAEAISMAVNALTTQEISDVKALEVLKGYQDLKNTPVDFIIPAGKAEILNMLVTMPNDKQKRIEATRPATRAEVAMILYRMIEEARLNPNAKLADVMSKKRGKGYIIEGATVQGSIGTIPAGAVVPVNLTKAVSSQSNTAGDLYEAVANANFVTPGDNFILIYKDSKFKGQLLDVRKGKWFVRNGVLVLDNSILETPKGQTIPFRASAEITKDRNWFMKIVRALLKGEKLDAYPDNTVEIKLLKPIKIDLTNGWIIQ